MPARRRHPFVQIARGRRLIGFHRDRMRLVDRAECRTIRNIHARELECPPTVVAAAGVELRCMVREGEQVLPEKLIEAKPCGLELNLGLFESPLRGQDVGQTPANLRIAARSAGMSSASASLGCPWLA